MNLKNIGSIEFYLLLFVPLTYIFFWDLLIISTAIAIVLIAVSFTLFHKPQDILIFSLGILLGSIGEIFSVYAGVWQYTKPLLFGLPPWLPLFWGYVFLLIRRMSVKTQDRKEPHADQTRSKMAQSFFLFIIYALLILFPTLFFLRNAIVFTGLAVISLILLYKAGSQDIFFAGTFSILGILLEILSVHLGIWKYPNPDILGIPVWLFLLYTGFSVFVNRTFHLISRHLNLRDL